MVQLLSTAACLTEMAPAHATSRITTAKTLDQAYGERVMPGVPCYPSGYVRACRSRLSAAETPTASRPRHGFA